VVLAVEKRQTSPLLEQSSVEKVVQIDTYLGAAISGLAADARTLIDHARVEAANHKFTYDEPLRTESLTQVSCDFRASPIRRDGVVDRGTCMHASTPCPRP